MGKIIAVTNFGKPLVDETYYVEFAEYSSEGEPTGRWLLAFASKFKIDRDEKILEFARAYGAGRIRTRNVVETETYWIEGR